MSGTLIQPSSTSPIATRTASFDWLDRSGSTPDGNAPGSLSDLSMRSGTLLAQSTTSKIRNIPFTQSPTRSVDQRLRLDGAAAKKFEAPFGAIGTAETQLSDLAFLQTVGYASLNPGIVSSSLEQSQAVQSNLITAATNDVAKLTAMRNQVNALYGQNLVSAGSMQASLAKINAALNNVRTVLETSAGSIAALNVRIGKGNFATEMSRLDKSLKALNAQIDGQRRAIQTDLKLADAQVAQIRANGKNEVSGSKIQLKTAIDSVQQSADKAATSSQINPGAAGRDPVSGVSLPATMLGTNGPLTQDQRIKMLRFFSPLSGVRRAGVDGLVEPTKPGQKPVTVQGVGTRVGVADYKANLQRLTQQYGSIDKAARALGLKDATQLTNLSNQINSGKFDPLKLNENLQTATGAQKKLLSDVGRVRTDFVKRLSAVDMKAKMEIVGKEVAAKTQIPEALKSYASEVGVNVNVLVGMAALQYGLSKTEATGDLALDVLTSPSPAAQIKAAKTYAKALADTGKLAPIANSLGNIERVKRVMIQNEALQLAQIGSDTALKNLQNTAANYENARVNVAATTNGTVSAIERTKTQIGNLRASYTTAKIAMLRSKGNETALGVLGQQFKLTEANLKRVLVNNEFSLKLANERLSQTQASGKQRIFSNLSLRIVTDMGDWNARYLSQAVKFGVMVNGHGLYARTPEGLIIPPTTLRLAMKGRDGTPTAAELNAASKLTLSAFGYGANSRSADLLTRRTPEAVAAVGVFLRGDPNAFISRSPIQTTDQSPSKVSFGPPTVFTYQQSPKATPGDTGNPYIPGALDPRINTEPAPIVPKVSPEAKLLSSDSSRREVKLGQLVNGSSAMLSQVADDPAQRAALWSGFGILIKKVGSETGPAGYEIRALPNDILSPGIQGSTADVRKAKLIEIALPQGGVTRSSKLNQLAISDFATLARYVDDPALRAITWSDFGIFVKRVGNIDSNPSYELYALPVEILSPGRRGSEAVAGQATLRERLRTEDVWKPRTD